MRFEKLDKRFKMRKAGLATHMVIAPIEESRTIEGILRDAFGPGTYVPEYQKTYHIRHHGDWYYSPYFSKKSAEGTRLLYYRYYFRREEQATYLMLAMQ